MDSEGKGVAPDQATSEMTSADEHRLNCGLCSVVMISQLGSALAGRSAIKY